MVATDDHDLARDLAYAAGLALLHVRDGVGFADAKALREAGDRVAHDFLTGELAEARPGDAVLSEEDGRWSEGAAPVERLGAGRVWIIDPLDGTREFSEEGRADWAVHVALWTSEAGLVAGAVALPAQGRVLSTRPAAGAVVTSDGEPVSLRVPAGDPAKIRIAVSRSRPPAFVKNLAGHLGADVELVPIGSAGAKISAVLLGEADAYVHAGGQYEWDSAAPVAVALAAGAHASRVDGADLAYNRENPWLPDILVCLPAIAPGLLGALRQEIA